MQFSANSSADKAHAPEKYFNVAQVGSTRTRFLLFLHSSLNSQTFGVVNVITLCSLLPFDLLRQRFF